MLEKNYSKSKGETYYVKTITKLREQLKVLQAQAEKILDEIDDQKEAEILRLENDKDLENLTRQRREIVEELISVCKPYDKKYWVDDRNEDIVYLREIKSDKNLAAFVYDDHDLRELEELVQTQIESTQFYDILVNIVGHSNLISAQVDSPVGIAFDEKNHAELVYYAESDRVTISHYRELSMKEARELMRKSLDAKNVTVEYAVSDEAEDEASLFEIKTVTVCDLLELAKSVKRIKESVNA